MTVAPVPPGTPLIDTDRKLDAITCGRLRALGKGGVIRYVGRGPAVNPGDLDGDELRIVMAAGLGLMAVQHCLPRFVATAALGAQYGAVAVAQAKRAGYAEGASLWCDFENCISDAAPAAEYLNAWCAAVRDGGYLDGVYYGADSPLDGSQLYEMLTTTRYWRAGSADTPIVAVRGHCMQQSLPKLIAGIAVEEDTVSADARGGLPLWMAA